MFAGKLLGGALALAVAGALTTGAALAQDKGKGKGKNEGPGAAATADSPARVAHLAHSLARYGDKTKDPVAMIAAARMLGSTGAQDKAPERASKGKPVDKPGADMSVAGLVARAKTYAGDRKDLVALADDAASSASRGPAQGPIRHVDTVNRRTNDIFNVVFNGGEAAYVGISGDGDTDLDLYIFDENGNLICRSVRAGDDEGCSFRPRWTGRFRIEVRNLGDVYNRYVLVAR